MPCMVLTKATAAACLAIEEAGVQLACSLQQLHCSPCAAVEQQQQTLAKETNHAEKEQHMFRISSDKGIREGCKTIATGQPEFRPSCRH